MDYINGEAYPLVKVQNLDGSLVEIITLELCGEGGLTESYQEDHKRVVLRKNRRFVDYDYSGSRITFTLDYSDYLVSNMMFIIELIASYNSQPENFKLILVPNSDNPARYFEVRHEGEWSQKLIADRIGHELPVMVFISVETVSKNFQNADYLFFPSPYYAAS